MANINRVIYTDGGRRFKKQDNFEGVGAGVWMYEYNPDDLENFPNKYPKIDAIFTPYGTASKAAAELYCSDGKLDTFMKKVKDKVQGGQLDADFQAFFNKDFELTVRGNKKGDDVKFTPYEQLGRSAKYVIPYLVDNEKAKLVKVAGIKTENVPLVTEVIIPLPQNETNNVAELTSFVEALKRAKGTCTTYLYSDSEYVVKGVTEYMATWKIRDWRKGDGQEVKNVEYWIQIDELMGELKDEGVNLIIEHVYSHRGLFGNEEADKLATMAIMMSSNGSSKIIEHQYTLFELGKMDTGKLIPRHLGLKWIYQYTNAEEQVSKIGDVEHYGYLIGDHVRKSSAPPRLVGKPQPDAIYGLVFGRDPVPVVKELTDETYKRTYRHTTNKMEVFDFFTLVNVGNVNRDATIESLRFGMETIKFNYSDYYMENLAGLPITIAMHKPMLSRRLYNIREVMSGLLGSAIALQGTENCLGEKPKDMVVYDLTDKFHDGKKMKPLTEDALDVEIEGVPLRLAIGIDVPGRSLLMDEVKHNLKVSLMVYNRLDNAYQYFCYVESDNIYGMFYNPYNNRRLLIDGVTDE